MSEVFNDFGFSTVSEEDFAATQKVEVDRDKEVATTATASIKPELETIEAKISSLAENMRTFKDDLDDRKEELNDKWKTKMDEVEELIVPLLKNLAKDGDKMPIIKWPNRTEILNAQIDRIQAVTRGELL